MGEDTWVRYDYAHDALCRLTQVSPPHGPPTTYQWNEFSQLTQLSQGINRTTWQYNAQGLVTLKQHQQHTTQYRYTADGQLKEQIDPLGNRHQWQYHQGVLQQYTDPLGHTTQYRFDHCLRPIERQLPNGHRERFEYTPSPTNPRGNISLHQHPDGHREYFEYDAEGLIGQHTNPHGHRQTYTHGPFDLLLSHADAQGQRWSLHRDAAGQVIGQTDWAGRHTRIVRNALGEITHLHRPDGSTLHYEYDDQDRLIRITGPSRQKRFEHNEHNQLTLAQVWINPTETADAQLESHVAWVYGPDHRLVQEIQDGVALNFEHNEHDQLTGLHTPSGPRLWSYTPLGQVQSLQSNRHRFEFEHNALGLEATCRYRSTQEHRGNQPYFIQRQAFDPCGRLTTQHLGEAVELPFDHPETVYMRQHRYHWQSDQLTRFESLEAQTSRVLQTFEHDSRNQITQAQHVIRDSRYPRIVHEQYRYTPNQHIQAQHRAEEPATRGLDHWGWHADELAFTRDETLSHDANGQVIKRRRPGPDQTAQVWTLAWDEFGQLREIMTPKLELWKYTYDALGRRTRKDCHHPRKTEPFDPPAQSPQQRFIWHGKQLLESWACQADGRTQVMRWHQRGANMPLAQEVVEGDQPPEHSCCYPLGCHPNGLPHTQFSTQGDVLNRQTHGVWGKVLEMKYPPYRGLKHPSEPPACNLRFAGQWFDEESGLHYNVHRYYSPDHGMYWSQDPIGLDGGLRTHGYVNNPNTQIDPWGLTACGVDTTERLTGSLSAWEANAEHVAKGNRPPYAEGTRARDIVLNDERTFVRVHVKKNQARSWMMRPNEIAELNAQQIQNKFALPELPTYISDVYAPAGSRIRLGTVGAQEGWGAGGGIQYELLQKLPGSAFRNMRPLP